MSLNDNDSKVGLISGVLTGMGTYIGAYTGLFIFDLLKAGIVALVCGFLSVAGKHLYGYTKKKITAYFKK